MKPKNKFSNFMLFIVGVVPLILIVHFAKPNLQNDFRSNSVSVIRQSVKNGYSEDFLNFQKFVVCIQDNKIAEMKCLLQELENIYLNDDVRNYLIDFRTYCQTEKKKDRNFKPVLNNIGIIKDYCDSELKDLDESTEYIETLLFFCMKNYEQYNKNANVLIKYCEEYINFVMQTKGYMSPKLAAIMCLHVRTYYESDGISKTDEKMKDVQNLINKYQQRYPDYFGENPKDGYEESCNYLRRFYELCKDIRDKHVADKFDRLGFDKKILLLEA